MSESQTRASIVIACHTEDRWALLLKAVDSARAQDMAGVEIVVVVDHNRALYERLRREVPGITVLENVLLPGASGARNTGAYATSGSCIAFLDDDAAADPNWLRELIAPLSSPGVVGTGGRVRPGWHSRRPIWFPGEFLWVVGASFVGMPTSTTTVRNVWAESMAVRRDVFESVEGFRTGFGKIGAHSRPEDTDLCIRMTAAGDGGRWVYVHDAVAEHYVPLARARYDFFVRRTFHEGRGKAELARLLPASSTALDSERDYVRRTLPVGVMRHLMGGATGNVGEPLQALSILVGLASTVSGFLYQRLRDRRGGTGATLVDSGAPSSDIELVA